MASLGDFSHLLSFAIFHTVCRRCVRWVVLQCLSASWWMLLMMSGVWWWTRPYWRALCRQFRCRETSKSTVNSLLPRREPGAASTTTKPKRLSTSTCSMATTSLTWRPPSQPLASASFNGHRLTDHPMWLSIDRNPEATLTSRWVSEILLHAFFTNNRMLWTVTEWQIPPCKILYIASCNATFPLLWRYPFILYSMYAAAQMPKIGSSIGRGGVKTCT